MDHTHTASWKLDSGCAGSPIDVEDLSTGADYATAPSPSLTHSWSYPITILTFTAPANDLLLNMIRKLNSGFAHL